MESKFFTGFSSEFMLKLGDSFVVLIKKKARGCMPAKSGGVSRRADERK